VRVEGLPKDIKDSKIVWNSVKCIFNMIYCVVIDFQAFW
jgi:hypothetical protein